MSALKHLGEKLRQAGHGRWKLPALARLASVSEKSQNQRWPPQTWGGPLGIQVHTGGRACWDMTLVVYLGVGLRRWPAAVDNLMLGGEEGTKVSVKLMNHVLRDIHPRSG